jgi:hypothetical protein
MKSVICNVWVYKETIAQMKKGGTHTHTHRKRERGDIKGVQGQLIIIIINTEACFTIKANFF